MKSSFGDAGDIIHIDNHLQEKVELSVNLLDCFNDDLKKIRLHFTKKRKPIQQDNTGMHTCIVAMAKIDEYSPDLAVVALFLVYKL